MIIAKSFFLSGSPLQETINKQDILESVLQVYDYNTIIEEYNNINELDCLQEDSHNYSIISIDLLDS